MKIWEYNVVGRSDFTLDSGYMLKGCLNDLGSEGWEMVVETDRYFIFKRPVEESDITK